MARQFLGLFLLLILTLAAASWAQDRLLSTYGPGGGDAERALRLSAAALAKPLATLPRAQWAGQLAAIAQASGTQLELIERRDIVGQDTLRRLARGEVATMQGADGTTWLLAPIDTEQLLQLRLPAAPRHALDWALTVAFYGIIALALIGWLWPLTRDLRTLERAAAGYGNRHWQFDAPIGVGSPVYPLASTFRRMATRIDSLIASHQELSHAVAHEIRTPLARMQFEIELAQRTDVPLPPAAAEALEHLKTDIASINRLVQATLEYAILERADLTLNIDGHDFTRLLPELLAEAKGDARRPLELSAQVASEAVNVRADAHLMLTAIRNLLANACRHAASRVAMTFTVNSEGYRLVVDDDGPGIPPAERERVFEPFVKLTGGTADRGFGLGLAIVHRILGWHGGTVSASASDWGGARFVALWPLAGGPGPL